LCPRGIYRVDPRGHDKTVPTLPGFFATSREKFLWGGIMWNDPIVEETRALREAYMKKFDYNLDAVFADLKAKEQTHPERMKHLQPHWLDRGSDNNFSQSRAETSAVG
jgi:hypothetical protein